MQYIFRKEKYMKFYKKSFEEWDEFIQKFLTECDGKTVDTSYSEYRPGWGFEVYGINDANWCIPCERLEVYCDKVFA